MPDDQMRDNQGRYRHTLDKLCVCGHSNGKHSAERYRNNAGEMEQDAQAQVS